MRAALKFLLWVGLLSGLAYWLLSEEEEGLYLDGRDDVIVLPASLITGQSRGTIAMRMKFLKPGPSCVLDCMTEGDSYRFFRIRVDRENRLTALMRKKSYDYYFYLRTREEIVPGRWYHLAVVQDGEQVVLYLNGARAEMDVNKAIPRNAPGAWLDQLPEARRITIGGILDGPYVLYSECFFGGCAFWDRPLDETTIARLADGELGAGELKPVFLLDYATLRLAETVDE